MKNEFEMYLEIHGTAFCFLGDLASKAWTNLYFPANVVLGLDRRITVKRADFSWCS